MENNKRVFYRIGLDGLILLCVVLPLLFLYLWGDPYKRGFFCNDESLMHPFEDSTVKNWMLYVVGLALPITIILLVEMVRAQQDRVMFSGNHTSRRYVFLDFQISNWLIEAYKNIGTFGFGVAISQLTTDIAKYSIGRLRPYFLTFCQPIIMPNGTSCMDPINFDKYIMDFQCKEGVTARMLKEARLSFPSGHSSFSFFTMIYLAIYLQFRLPWHGTKLLRHFFQLIFIMMAWYTALTRVSDYKHHWSDVLAGSVIGSLTAVIVAKYVSDLFSEKSTSNLASVSHTVREANSTQSETITSNGQ